MRIKTIEKLCCPFDKSDVTLQIFNGDEQGNVFEGVLLCAHCSRVYPIVSGIPIMSPDEFRDFRLEQPMFDKWEKLLNENSENKIKVIEGKMEEVR